VELRQADRRAGERLTGALVIPLVLLAPVGAFIVLRLVPGLDVLFQSATFHIAVVSAIAACALVVAVVAATAAARSRQGAPVVLALGCLAVGTLMLGHGLTTPGIGNRPLNLWVARLPVLAISAFALALATSLLPPRSAPLRMAARRARALLALWGAGLTAGVAAIVLSPHVGSGAAPLAWEDEARMVATYAGAAVLGATGIAYWRRWRLSLDPVQLALGAASWLGAEALLSLHLGRLWRLSWWDYHALLLVGFGAAVYAVLASYRRTRTIEDTLAGLFRTDPMEQISLTQPEALRALVAAVEAKDGYTHGHSARVAATSVRLGQRMGLRPQVLRRLAQGALLHDIGKIGIPDEILNKPGALTREERARIEEHPVIGWDIVQRAPTLREALHAVRHHHERFDGDGYPDGLRGDEIPLVARIVAVADVWDALTSDRAYRPAWSRQRAVDHMAAARGTQFDPVSLDAFLGLLEYEGLRPGTGPTEPSVVLAAAEACHAPVEAPRLG
jgi:HD-GYP domain-containing protein (c-di-GMP phosphodiesterase class II)